MLEVFDLQKSYGTYKSVKNVSFTAQDHEVVALLGRNGAGKSTTMRMLAGYLAPTAGRILLCGQSLTDHPLQVKRQIGYLPEIPPLYPYMTVDEQLRFVCDLRAIPAKAIKAECARVCDLLHIAHVSHRTISHLSKGYRQRVGFAASLIGQPKLLILDEPTVGLDPQQVLEIRKLILQLAGQMTVLISSHILSEIACVSSHLLILRNGELVADGTPQAITERFTGENTLRLGLRGDLALAEATLRSVVDGRAEIVSQPSQNQTVFLLKSPQELHLQESLYRAFAPLCPQVILTSMNEHAPSLEDIFVNITSGNKPSKEADAV